MIYGKHLLKNKYFYVTLVYIMHIIRDKNDPVDDWAKNGHVFKTHFSF